MDDAEFTRELAKRLNELIFIEDTSRVITDAIRYKIPIRPASHERALPIQIHSPEVDGVEKHGVSVLGILNGICGTRGSRHGDHQKWGNLVLRLDEDDHSVLECFSYFEDEPAAMK